MGKIFAVVLVLFLDAGAVFIDLHALLAMEGPFYILRQCLRGGIGVGKQRVAAPRRDLDGIENGRLGGTLEIGRVGMEHHFAIGQRADGLAVLADVADQHHVGAVFVQLRRFRTGARAGSERAEFFGEYPLLVVGNILVTEQKDLMFVPGIEQRARGLRIYLITQIDTAHFGTDGIGQTVDLDLAHHHHRPGNGQFGLFYRLPEPDVTQMPSQRSGPNMVSNRI